MAHVKAIWASLALIIVAVLARPLAAAEADWRMLVTPRYTVLSQLNDRDTRAWAGEFDQFIASLSNLLKLNPATLPSLTVVLFLHDRDFDPYKPALPNGSQAHNVAGFFNRTETWGVIGMADRAADEQTRRTIFHEGVHWLMSADPSPQPTWFSEGIAELFSTFGVVGDKVHWGEPIGGYLEELKANRLMPLKQLLERRESLFDTDRGTNIYYAQSWAFVHFLLLSGHPERREMLARYLDAYHTKSAEESFQAAFGANAAQVERDFSIYLDQTRFGYGLTPRQPVPPLGAIVAASPAVVESALSRLALYSADKDLAARHAQKALDLNPALPGGYEVKAYLALRENEPEKALEAAQHAVRTGSSDAVIIDLVADGPVESAGNSPPDRARWRVAMYENAINLRPTLLRSYELLVHALGDLDKPTEQDAKFLGIGRKIFPHDSILQIGLAQIAYKQGQPEQAIQQMDALLQSDADMDPGYRSYAQSLREAWLMQEMRARFEPLFEQRQYDKARAVISDYRPRFTQPQSLDYLDRLRVAAEVHDLVSRADKAQRAGRPAEARQLFEQLLARQDLTTQMRDFAERALGALKRGR